MKNLCFALAFFLPAALFAQSGLSIGAENVYIEARENGYHLFVKKVPQISSILLTESFEREDHKVPTYSLRAPGNIMRSMVMSAGNSMVSLSISPFLV
jgi:hypothetical protein